MRSRAAPEYLAWVLLVMGAVLCAPSVASADDIDDLEVLFEEDPAEGFVVAAKMFQHPLKAGDLEGMMDIIELTAEWGGHCLYFSVADDMIDAAIPVARDAGEWGLLGDIYAARVKMICDANCDYHKGGCYYGGFAMLPRLSRQLALAEEAYAKAGSAPPGFAELRASVPAAALSSSPTYNDYCNRLRPEDRPLVDDIYKMVVEGRDSDALDPMNELLERIDPENLTGSDSAAFALLGFLVWLRGAEDLVRPMMAMYEAQYDHTNHASYMSRWKGTGIRCGCELGWSGFDDAYYNVLRGGYADYWANLGMHQVVPALFILKLERFGRYEEAEGLLRDWLDWIMRRPPIDEAAWAEYYDPLVYGSPHVVNLIHSRTPPDLLPILLELTFRNLHWGRRPSTEPYRAISADDGRLYQEILDRALPGEEQARALEMAHQLLATAFEFPEAAVRSQGAAEAAGLFKEAGREDLAAEAEALAKQIAANDPKAMLQCALSTAQSHAEQGKWEDVTKSLEAAVTKYASGKPGLQAFVLLAEASDELGKTDQAETWVTKASGLVDQAELTSVERANYLWYMASLTTKQDEQVALLQKAQQAAAEAELSFLEEKIADRLAEVALAAGNLALAEEKLIEIVKRQEEEREQLAFDPLLRQEWFADNIGPYRRLMRVAALRDKPHLALDCAERMRSRALLDQLSWQKVDVGLRLGRGLKKELTRLREMRKEAYALLQRVLGGRPSDDDTRGMYMPVRGMYMPVRGALGDGRAATEEDVAYLRDLLDDLAREEEALNASIREEIPDYWEDCYAEIPSSEELEETIASQDGLAVLEYTFCDEGLAAVGMTSGHDARVLFIDEKGEEMWERIGKFRQLIWERKPEFIDEARKLYATLVAPFEDMLAEADRVWIVADGALQLLPFGALVDANNTYLSTRMAVATVPSLSLMMTPRETVKAPEATALIVAAPDTGAPVMAGDKRGLYMPIRGMYMPVRGMYMPIRGEDGVSCALTMMANVPLPGAKAEGEAIAERVANATLLTDKEATRARLLEEAGRCEVLHIATHGYADPDFPEFSGLLLAGEGDEKYDVLTAQDVRFWSLRARLVTLSACQTALGKVVEGEGLLGLTRAFIYAGAQDVLCSLWPVSDESTKALMVSFYEELDKGVTVEEALQHAQGKLMQSEATSHPFYWAGFIPVRGPE